MKFSIIIPAHNEQYNIDKVLQSIKNQSYTDYELIVICDSCTDNTEQIAKSYGAITKVVDYHTDGLTRNAGIDIAQGEWLLFIDADDWYLHEFVLQQIANKLEEVDCDVLCFGIIWKNIGYVSPISGRNNELFPHCVNKAWKRAFVGDTRFSDKKVANDGDFHISMMAKHPKLDIWEMPIYYYNYLRKGSKSDSLGRTVNNTKNYWGLK